jgi:hypothetical protein
VALPEAALVEATTAAEDAATDATAEDPELELPLAALHTAGPGIV